MKISAILFTALLTTSISTQALAIRAAGPVPVTPPTRDSVKIRTDTIKTAQPAPYSDTIKTAQPAPWKAPTNVAYPAPITDTVNQPAQLSDVEKQLRAKRIPQSGGRMERIGNQATDSSQDLNAQIRANSVSHAPALESSASRKHRTNTQSDTVQPSAQSDVMHYPSSPGGLQADVLHAQ